MNNTPNTGAGMSAFGEMSVQDYFGLVKRRRLWIIFPAMAVIIATSVAAWRLPNVYYSSALILISPQKVPASYVTSTVTTGTSERLAAIYHEVTSPTRLKRIIDSLGLYPDLRKQEGEQEAIAAMQKAIIVEPVAALNIPNAALRIAFKSRNPVQAAQVVNQVAAMFLEENLKTREEQSYGTADFIDGELQRTTQLLDEKGKELAEVHARHAQDLPESGQFHIQAAESLRTQLRGTEDRITQDQQQKIYLQSLEASSARTVDLDLGASGSPNESQVEELQTKLNALQGRYGPNHPDVRKLQAQIDQTKATQAETPAPKTTTPALRKSHNPVIEAQLEQLDQDIEKQKSVASQLQSEISFHLSKIQSMPAFDQKTESVQRDYNALQGRYMSLEDKKLSALTATDMESREKSERFVLLYSGQVPERPYSPDRPLIVFGGIVFGVLIGAGVGLAREVVDDSVRNEREAERILGARVLSGVPEILNAQQMWQSALKMCSVATATVVVAFVLGLGIAHFSGRFF
jgi:protein tyrosine kinase modulator